MGRLSHGRIKVLATPGLHGDGDTLYLRVAAGGSKSWMQRVTINGRRRDLGLGSWPVVSLARARQRAFANRVAISEGRDPLAEKRKASVPTFREAATRTFELNRPRWRSQKTAANWTAQMELHAFPVLATLPVNEIGREAVLRVLTPIWTAHPDIARKLRGRIRAVLAWAQAHDYIEHNVAGEAIDAALPAMPAVTAHYRALPYAEVGKALESVEASTASLVVKGMSAFRGAHHLPVWRGSGREVEGDRRQGARVAHPGFEDEGERRASRAAVRCGGGGAGPGSAVAQRLRSGVSIPAGPGVVRRDDDQVLANCGHRRRAAWLSYVVQDLGQRTDQRAARGRGDGARACRRVLGRAELCTV